MLKILKDEVKSQALEISQNIIDEAKLSAKQEAKKIIITSIQRLGTEEAIDNCVSVFNIESAGCMYGKYIFYAFGSFGVYCAFWPND